MPVSLIPKVFTPPDDWLGEDLKRLANHCSKPVRPRVPRLRSSLPVHRPTRQPSPPLRNARPLASSHRPWNTPVSSTFCSASRIRGTTSGGYESIHAAESNSMNSPNAWTNRPILS